MDNSRMNQPNLNYFQFLPPEIITMIMVSFPPKMLGICKCVCKSWRDNIKSIEFMKDNALVMKFEDKRLYLSSRERDFQWLNYSRTKLGSDYNIRELQRGEPAKKILACSEGLILYASRSDRFFLMNPITNEQSEIPFCHIPFPFYVKECCCFFGMKFNPENNEYIIVRIAYFTDRFFKTDVKLFSTLTSRWIIFPPFRYNSPIVRTGIVANRKFHWMVNMDGKLAISAMDIEYIEYNNAYKLIKVPLDVENTPRECELNVLNNERLLLYRRTYNNADSAHFWILEDYGDETSWIQLKIKVDPQLTAEFHGISVMPICQLSINSFMILCQVWPLGIFVIYDYMEDVYYPIDSIQTNPDRKVEFWIWQGIMPPPVIEDNPIVL